MGRDDDVYVSPMISKQAHGYALLRNAIYPPNPVRIMRFSSSPEQGANTRDVDARGATALSERG
jgi:hypothetical protein